MQVPQRVRLPRLLPSEAVREPVRLPRAPGQGEGFPRAGPGRLPRNSKRLLRRAVRRNGF